MSTESARRRFAIGLSFPGEVREFAKELDQELSAYFGADRIFFDARYEHELGGVDLDLKLRTIYREQCDLVVPVFCRHYEKPWCQVEWSSIRALMLMCREEDRILPVALDNTEVPGWEKTDLSIQVRDRSTLAIAEVLRMAHEHRFANQIDSSASSQTTGGTAMPPAVERSRLRDVTEQQLQAGDLQTSLKEIRSRVTAIVKNDSVRQWLLQASGMNSLQTPETLVEEIFAVRPMIRSGDKPQTPMCFVHKCVVALQDVRPVDAVIIDSLEALAALLLPLSVEDRHGTSANRFAQAALGFHAVAGDDKVIGASIIGRLLGLRVAIDNSGSTMLRNAIHPNLGNEAVAIDGLGAPDLLAAVRKMLCGVLMARSDSPAHIRAALRVWAARKAYVCVWVMSYLDPKIAAQLLQELPSIILLHGDGEDASEVNPLVMHQLQEIEHFIASHRGQRT